MATAEHIINYYQELRADQRSLRNSLRAKKFRSIKLKRHIDAHEVAGQKLNLAVEELNKEVISKAEHLITLAIRAVYERPFTFKLVFKETKRGTEAKPVITEGKHKYDPKSQTGGGLLEVASFGFRIVLWHFKDPQTRNVFILDESFKWAGKYIKEVGKMLKFISDELKIQIILVSHEDELIGICDKIYYISHNGTESIVNTYRRKIKRRKK